MAEDNGKTLGEATLILTADTAALDQSLEDAKARVTAAVTDMQAQLDSLHIPGPVNALVRVAGALRRVWRRAPR